MTATKNSRRRCATYTRKSSEEGLEQDFNSLDAQREAGEAYVLSQKHAGWMAISTLYDDGGISGATMERPALQRLLADISGRKVDVVVVYKVDRLTRSLADFAKIVEIFDAHGVSFVSVTQQFNTTTSMGRLTLNVLLSFAQFEREVTGERIRDKIAASKKKGMWMGGHVPLGYDVRDRKLVVNEAEAETVRHIYRRYLELGSVQLLQQELDEAGIVSKVRQRADGRCTGGQRLARGALYLLLQNRHYLGEIVHKDKSYPGEHEAIIDRDLWDAVQRTLGENRAEQKVGDRAQEPSPLAGLIHDQHGERMTPTHAVKAGRRYRYYVSRSLVTGTRAKHATGQRVPAGDVESLVAERTRTFLGNGAEVHDAIGAVARDSVDQQVLLARASGIADGWNDLSVQLRRHLVRALIARVDLLTDRVDIRMAPTGLIHVLRVEPIEWAATDASNNESETFVVSIPARLKRAGLGVRMIVDGTRADRHDPSLIKLIARAHRLRERLVSGKASSVTEIAQQEGVTASYCTRLLRVGFLAPDIVRVILHGRHPLDLTAARLLRDSQLPFCWTRQLGSV